MRFLLLLMLAASLGAKPRVERVTVFHVEKEMDRTLEREVLDGNGYLLLGYTRGVFLEGTGAVFSAEVNLAAGPTVSPFRPQVTKDDTTKLRQRKLDKLPPLRVAMRRLLFDIAARLEGLNADEEIVVAVTLFHHHWEDTAGLPGQIVMRAPKKKLTEIPTSKRDPEKLESLIKVEEF
jgi:hypothetical protein